MSDYLSKLKEIVKEDQRYDLEAYLFVNQALEFLLGKLGKKRHVSGQELLEGIREYALQEYGPLSKNVLEYWGIYSCEDFGEIVFNMVGKKLMGKTERDSKKDFRHGYNFEEAFERPFRRQDSGEK